MTKKVSSQEGVDAAIVDPPTSVVPGACIQARFSYRTDLDAPRVILVKTTSRYVASTWMLSSLGARAGAGGWLATDRTPRHAPLLRGARSSPVRLSSASVVVSDLNKHKQRTIDPSAKP